VKFTQFLSENILVYAGKINTLDDIKQPLTGAGILTGFQNTAFVLNPVYARTVPYSTFGAGFGNGTHSGSATTTSVLANH
jgi:porin